MFDTLTNFIRGSIIKSQVKAYYIPETHLAYIPQPRGNFMNTMGRATSSGDFFLQFHEFVYLAERGTVTPFIKTEELDIPLSIQDLYVLFKDQNELDTFAIYAHLKRLGFIVTSADDTSYDTTSFYAPSSVCSKRSHLQLLYNALTGSLAQQKISLHNRWFFSPWNFYFQKYTSSPQLYRGLNTLIPSTNIPKTVIDLRGTFRDTVQNENTDLKINFNVWKPQTNYKKKSPGLPDYQVVIYNKNDPSSHFPTYSEIKGIFNSLDYKFEFLQEGMDWDASTYTNGIKRSEYLTSLKSKAKQKKSSDNPMNKNVKTRRPASSFSPQVQQLRRLRNGFRTFLLAIMDDGIISFVKISEADFGSENVWHSPMLHKVRKSPFNRNKKNGKNVEGPQKFSASTIEKK